MKQRLKDAGFAVLVSIGAGWLASICWVVLWSVLVTPSPSQELEHVHIFGSICAVGGLILSAAALGALGVAAVEVADLARRWPPEEPPA